MRHHSRTNPEYHSNLSRKFDAEIFSRLLPKHKNSNEWKLIESRPEWESRTSLVVARALFRFEILNDNGSADDAAHNKRQFGWCVI